MAKAEEKTDDKKTEKVKDSDAKKICGLVMPISPHKDYSPSHWLSVKAILEEAINDQTDFVANLVSVDTAIGLIHERIVNNLYSNEIVVCDVSSKNPNVMFELGLRLAFDKPTVIIKDELTDYIFDTGGIEHLAYPSSLSYLEIVSFKDQLAKRIKATYSKAIKDKEYSPFLKSFGKHIIPANFKQTDVDEVSYIHQMLEKIDIELRYLKTKLNDTDRPIRNTDPKVRVNERTYFQEIMDKTVTKLSKVAKVEYSFVKEALRNEMSAYNYKIDTETLENLTRVVMDKINSAKA